MNADGRRWDEPPPMGHRWTPIKKRLIGHRGTEGTERKVKSRKESRRMKHQGTKSRSGRHSLSARFVLLCLRVSFCRLSSLCPLCLCVLNPSSSASICVHLRLNHPRLSVQFL